MSASACLRILLDLSDEKLARLDALGPLIAKVTGAFLESRWFWPKRYELLTPFSFMLTDPRATDVDIAQLELLAEALQQKLFGTSDAGDVTLLLFDGDDADTAKFMQMDHAALKRATQEPLQAAPFAGRLLKISTAASAPSTLRWRTLERAPVKVASDGVGGLGAIGTDTTFRGVYFAPRQFFIGSIVSAPPTAASPAYSLVDGQERLPREREAAFDMASLGAGRRQLSAPPFGGSLFLPVCFSSLMRRSSREAYEAQFHTLPIEKRPQLSAVVYDVPRSPAFQAFAEIHSALGEHFSSIDLQVNDAGFEIDSIPQGAVNSVTFRLPEGDARLRLAALRRFMEKRDHFKQRKIWPAVTNVRTPAELADCIQHRIPFLSGLAICGPVDAPVGSLSWEIDRLPLTAARRNAHGAPSLARGVG